jgi:hypothetical protein
VLASPEVITVLVALASSAGGGAGNNCRKPIHSALLFANPKNWRPG